MVMDQISVEIIFKKWAVKWTEGKRTQIMRWKKDNLQIFTLKNVLRQLLFLEIVSITKIKNKQFRCMFIKWWWGSI